MHFFFFSCWMQQSHSSAIPTPNYDFLKDKYMYIWTLRLINWIWNKRWCYLQERRKIFFEKGGQYNRLKDTCHSSLSRFAITNCTKVWLFKISNRVKARVSFGGICKARTHCKNIRISFTRCFEPLELCLQRVR